MRLNKEFYFGDNINIAKNLLGKVLVTQKNGVITKGKIVEVEAYDGLTDKASHAYKNKKTKRTQIFFKDGGISYVYLIYGMYNCMNVITNGEDKPQAILIRALEPIYGLDTMKERRKIDKEINLCNGPGKLCIAMDIDTSLNNINLENSNELYINQGEDIKEEDIVKTKRINIDYAEEAKDFLWRFYIKGNKYISKK